MDFPIAKSQLNRILSECLRKAGYISITDHLTQKDSFVRRLSKTQFYPRFHLYVTEDSLTYHFSLHLDQKKPIYHAKGVRAHNADYDDPLVAEEKQRIISSLN